MDIIRFINSRDIAEYLRKIDYKFSPEEAMFLIHEGKISPLQKNTPHMRKHHLLVYDDGYLVKAGLKDEEN